LLLLLFFWQCERLERRGSNKKASYKEDSKQNQRSYHSYIHITVFPLACK
jgi:hypothetical protein